MKIQYGWQILAGLIIFLGIFALPFVFNATSPAYQAPEVKLPDQATVTAAGYDKVQCVESKEFMRTSHMQLLNEWRDWALRDGKRTYVGKDGVQYKISLQNTCMKCHTSKKEFCDKCHNVAEVTPYCWDCHYTPEELRNEK